MAQIIDITKHLPHVTTTTHDENVHILPLSMLIDIAKGRKTVDDLEHKDALLRVIVSEWLIGMGLSDPEALLECDPN